MTAADRITTMDEVLARAIARERKRKQASEAEVASASADVRAGYMGRTVGWQAQALDLYDGGKGLGPLSISVRLGVQRTAVVRCLRDAWDPAQSGDWSDAGAARAGLGEAT